MGDEKDPKGTAGAPIDQPKPGATPADGAPPPDGPAPPPPPAAPLYRFKVGDEEQEFASDEEVSARLARARELEVKMEQLERERAAREAERIERELSLDSASASPAAAGYAPPVRGFHDGLRPPGDDAGEIDLSQLDPNDPRDAATIRVHQRQRQLEENAAAQAIAMRLREQIAHMQGNPDRYPGFKVEECQSFINRAVQGGKRLDFFDAYYILRGRRAPAEVKDGIDKEREAALREAASNRTTLGAVAVGTPTRRSAGNANLIPRARVVSMTVAEYAKATRVDGYAPDAEGNLVKRA